MESASRPVELENNPASVASSRESLDESGDVRAEAKTDNVIYQDLVETLFATKGSFLAGIAAGMLAPIVAWLSTWQDVYLLLIILMSGMAAYRVSVLLAYTRQPPAQRRRDARRWELRYAIGAVGFMTAVGVTAAILFVDNDEARVRAGTVDRRDGLMLEREVMIAVDGLKREGCLQHRERVILRAVVDDDDFHFRVLKCEQRTRAVLDRLSFIVGRRQQCDRRRVAAGAAPQGPHLGLRRFDGERALRDEQLREIDSVLRQP